MTACPRPHGCTKTPRAPAHAAHAGKMGPTGPTTSGIAVLGGVCGVHGVITTSATDALGLAEGLQPIPQLSRTNIWHQHTGRALKAKCVLVTDAIGGHAIQTSHSIPSFLSCSECMVLHPTTRKIHAQMWWWHQKSPSHQKGPLIFLCLHDLAEAHSTSMPVIVIGIAGCVWMPSYLQHTAGEALRRAAEEGS